MAENTHCDVVLPGQTVGILGGGQLGRMIALEGRKMGYRFATLDPTQNSPAAQVADVEIVGAYTDVDKAAELAQVSDVITYEFENVDVAVARVLEEHSVVPQGSRLLEITRNRLLEKTTLDGIGVPVTPFRPVQSASDFESALDVLGIPCVLKTTTGGYDGKGQWVIRSREDVHRVTEELFGHSHPLVDGLAPFTLEAFVTFECEVSVVVARSRRGETKPFPVAENIHVNQILHKSIVPARVTEEVEARAKEIAIRIAEGLEVTGLIAVEMFVKSDGTILVNELAPRPHNSGHYTLDACVTSQFEQHLRAVCNLPLGDTSLLSPVVMVNLLGQHMQAFHEMIPSLPGNVKIHLYGKAEAKRDRKMGHVNIVGGSLQALLAQANEFEISVIHNQ